MSTEAAGGSCTELAARPVAGAWGQYMSCVHLPAAVEARLGLPGASSRAAPLAASFLGPILTMVAISGVLTM